MAVTTSITDEGDYSFCIDHIDKLATVYFDIDLLS